MISFSADFAVGHVFVRHIATKKLKKNTSKRKIIKVNQGKLTDMTETQKLKDLLFQYNR